MQRKYAIYSSPIGDIRIEHRAGKLTRLQISGDEGVGSDEPHKGERDPFTDAINEQVVEYLRGERREFDVEVDLSDLPPFQKSVLNELRNIPYAETRSYREIAEAVGSPRAYRAVGSANNRNPIHIIIPCHRVIGASGLLRGYAAGVETKEFLLRMELLNRDRCKAAKF